MIKTIFFSFFLISSIALCQVNTESMRGNNQSMGMTHNMSLDFSYFSGSLEIIQLMGAYKMSYLTNSNWYGFLAARYNRAFEKDKEDFSNRVFLHLRAARPIITQTDIEGFIQKESNHFINLEDRELLGGGLRINQVENLYWGIGIMHEMEKYNNISKEQNLIKSTNYINYQINQYQLKNFFQILIFQ